MFLFVGELILSCYKDIFRALKFMWQSTTIIGPYDFRDPVIKTEFTV